MLLYRGIVAAAYVIFACNVAISYYHALEWFKEIGDFPGIFAHLAVVGVDTVFAVSSVVISTGITRKIRLGFPVWLCFLFGLLITGWSNVRACLHDQEEGIIAGLAIPAALLCIKLLLSWMTSNKTLFASPSKVENSVKVETSPFGVENAKMETSNEVAKVEEMLEKTPPTKMDIPPVDLEDHTKKKFPPQWVEEVIHHQYTGDNSNIKTPVKSEERMITKMEESPQETPPAKLQEPAPEKSSTSKKMEKKENTKAREVKSSTTSEGVEKSPLEWAILLHQQDGELPGRKRLMEASGCSEWVARKTIGELKKKIG